MGTIYLILLLCYLGLVFFVTPRLHYYNMHTDYSRILVNEPELKKARKQLYTTSWLDRLKKQGYEVVQEDLKHIMFCKYFNKLPNLRNSDPTLVFITVAKNNTFDFYSDEVDQGLAATYMMHKSYEKVTRRITLQFKKYDKINEKAIKEVETAILYQAGRQSVINLSFVYEDSKQILLRLNTGGWYPNKYVYFAFDECKRLCDIKE